MVYIFNSREKLCNSRVFYICLDFLLFHSQVFESFENLDTFTEMFSRNTVDEIESLDEKYWQRKRSRCILSHAKDELVLPAGTRGLTFQYKQGEWRMNMGSGTSDIVLVCMLSMKTLDGNWEVCTCPTSQFSDVAYLLFFFNILS